MILKLRKSAEKSAGVSFLCPSFFEEFEKGNRKKQKMLFSGMCGAEKLKIIGQCVCNMVEMITLK